MPRLRGWPEAEAQIAALGVDTLVTCMTMMIVPASLLELFGNRAANFHPAMLPSYRGPSPFLGLLLDEQADARAGLSMHVLTPGIDEGPVIAQQLLPFSGAGRDYQIWLAQHAALCRRFARDALPAYLDGHIEAVAQVGGSYRRVEDEAVLGPHMMLAEAERVLGIAGETRRIVASVPGRRRPVSVKRIERVLGRPTGEAPVIDPVRATLDLADARVRLVRNTAVDRLGDRLRLIRALRRLDQE